MRLARREDAPKYTVTDKGAQFQEVYLAWCERHGVKPRFGAIGRHGSIALVERFIRSLKARPSGATECRSGPHAMQAALESLCRRGTAATDRTRDSEGGRRSRSSKGVRQLISRLDSSRALGIRREHRARHRRSRSEGDAA